MNNIIIHKNQIDTNLNYDINLIIISDIHADSLSKRIENFKILIEKVAKINPDYILIPGDSIQSYRSLIKNIEFVFSEFGKIAPTIISLGNHELEACQKRLNLNWFYNLERFYQVYPLDNSSITINSIQFTGFSPNLEAYFPFTKNAEELFLQKFINSSIQIDPNALFKIMLTHNPNFITNTLLTTNPSLAEYDLFVSGHNHNGCVPDILDELFYHYGFFGPYFTLFPKKCRGIIDIYNSKLFVSKGYRKFAQENIISNTIDQLYNRDVHQLVLKKKN